MRAILNACSPEQFLILNPCGPEASDVFGPGHLAFQVAAATRQALTYKFFPFRNHPELWFGTADRVLTAT